MQIHYMWVNDFGRLKKTGINLSARLIINMVPDKNHIGQYILTIEENPDYIENFFHKDNITNVSAVIGKNGAGKTTILNYIKSNLPQGLEANVNNDLFIYSTGEQQQESFVIIKPELIEVTLNNLTTIKFDEKVYGDEAGETFRFTGGLSHVEYIYYSYLIDFNEEVTPWKGLTNISTAYLMLEERRRISEENKIEATRNALLAQSNDLDNLHLSEVSRAIQFLIADAVPLPFEKPQYLNIEVDPSDVLFFTDQKEKYPQVFDVIKSLRNTKSLKNDKTNDLINNLMLAILVNYLVGEYRYGINTPYYHELNTVGDENVREYVLDYFRRMANINLTYQGKDVESPRHELLAKLVPSFLELFEQLIVEKTIVVSEPLNFRLLLNEKTQDAFIQFSQLYLQIKGIPAFLKFRWRTLSGGEQSYLSLMSRFYHVRHHSHGDLPHNLVILIDEGDIGYHPQWQRQFFNTTLKFLSELFDQHQVQLIMAANTPYLSSDLPKSHVLFIEQIDEKLSIVHGKANDRAPTFAANIHTLFSDSFYMEGILIGEFARERINEIIKYLNEPVKSGLEPKDEYKKTIDLIGEAVLRKKLQDMWFEKFGLDEELKMLQRRIDEINRLKKS